MTTTTPPSRASWVWHLASQALQHCCAVGSRIEDLEVRVIDLEGVVIVSVSDWSLKKRGIPLLIASGAIPGADSSIKEDLRKAIVSEETRVRGKGGAAAGSQVRNRGTAEG